jgi:hypothetical protein
MPAERCRLNEHSMGTWRHRGENRQPLCIVLGGIGSVTSAPRSNVPNGYLFGLSDWVGRGYRVTHLVTTLTASAGLPANEKRPSALSCTRRRMRRSTNNLIPYSSEQIPNRVPNERTGRAVRFVEDVVTIHIPLGHTEK